MSEVKSKRTTRSSTRNREPQIVQPPRREPQTEKQPQQAKNNAKKRAPQQRSLFGMGFRREETEPVQETKQILSSVKQLLKTTSIESIMENCPKIRSFFHKLCEKSFVDGKLVIRCLDKYFHGNTTSLWEVKYAPKDLQDIFQADFAEKVNEWIKDFYYFRKKNEELEFDFGFIDDEEPDSYSKSLEARMKEYGWNCRALVLKGRTGVGKSSLLTSIAKSMKIKCFEFSSAFDQLQKMKQLQDGSRSEVVTNMNGNKKKEQQDNKIMMANHSIACFMPGMKNDKDTTLETKQPKRMQIFRDFSQYYPPFEKSDKQGIQQTYFKYLFDKIEKSTFPYALTSAKFDISFKERNLNAKFSNFDEIEFIEPSVEDLSNFFWIVLQIEKFINLQINKKIKKEDIFNELNEQFCSLNFDQELEGTEFIERIVIKANKKLHYIFKYLQFRVLPFLKNQQRTKTNESKQKQQFSNSANDEMKHEGEVIDAIEANLQEQLEDQEKSENQINKSNSQKSYRYKNTKIHQQKYGIVEDQNDSAENQKKKFEEKMLIELGFDILDNIEPDDLINNIEWCYFSEKTSLPSTMEEDEGMKIIDLELEERNEVKYKIVKTKKVSENRQKQATTPSKKSEENNQMHEKIDPKKLQETHERSMKKGEENEGLASGQDEEKFKYSLGEVRVTLKQEKSKQEQSQKSKEDLVKTAVFPRPRFSNKSHLLSSRNMFRLKNVVNESQSCSRLNPQQSQKVQRVREGLSMACLEDRKIFHNQYYHHFSHKIPEEKNQLLLVKTQTHVKAKKSIAKKMKRSYLYSLPYFNEGSNSYKNNILLLLNRIWRNPRELFYLPLAFPSPVTGRRSSRNSSLRRMREMKIDQNLSKFLQERRELEYLMKFTKFLTVGASTE